MESSHPTESFSRILKNHWRTHICSKYCKNFSGQKILLSWDNPIMGYTKEFFVLSLACSLGRALKIFAVPTLLYLKVSARPQQHILSTIQISLIVSPLANQNAIFSFVQIWTSTLRCPKNTERCKKILCLTVFRNSITATINRLYTWKIYGLVCTVAGCSSKLED